MPLNTIVLAARFMTQLCESATSLLLTLGRYVQLQLMAKTFITEVIIHKFITLSFLWVNSGLNSQISE